MDGAGVAAELKALAELRDSGELSQAEYDELRARLLGTEPKRSRKGRTVAAVLASVVVLTAGAVGVVLWMASGDEQSTSPSTTVPAATTTLSMLERDRIVLAWAEGWIDDQIGYYGATWAPNRQSRDVVMDCVRTAWLNAGRHDLLTDNPLWNDRGAQARNGLAFAMVCAGHPREYATSEAFRLTADLAG